MTKTTTQQRPTTGWPISARIAAVLFLAHVALLFLPPIPPITRGSLLSHGLAFAFFIAGGFAVAARHDVLLNAWGRHSSHQRLLRVIGAAALLGTAGAIVYTFAPGLFERFSAEEGVWEPLGTLCYLAAAILLYKTAQLRPGKQLRRHLLFMTGLYAFLFLEEINYFEIIGGILPRIGGEYIGAAHNVIDLWASGVISPGVAAALTLIAALLAFELWWIGLFQPGTILSDQRYPRFLFVQFGVGAIAVAIGIETGAIGWREGVQKPEELFEAIGAVFLLAYGLDIASAALQKKPSSASPPG